MDYLHFTILVFYSDVVFFQKNNRLRHRNRCGLIDLSTGDTIQSRVRYTARTLYSRIMNGTAKNRNVLETCLCGGFPKPSFPAYIAAGPEVDQARLSRVTQ